MSDDKTISKTNFNKGNKPKKSREAFNNPYMFFIPNVYGQIVRIKIRGERYKPDLRHEFPNATIPFFVVKRWTLQTAINLVEDLINYETYKLCPRTAEEISREDTARLLLGDTYDAYQEIKMAASGHGHLDTLKFPEDEIEVSIKNYDLNGNQIVWVKKGSDHLNFMADNSYTVIRKTPFMQFARWLEKYRDSHDTTLHQDAALQYINAVAFHVNGFVLE